MTTATAGERVRAFVPPPLPPDPALDIGPRLKRLAEAERALGRLDGVATVLPNPPLFIYMYVRKEALLSSQIEGTQSSFSDLLLFEADAIPSGSLDDVLDVSNYIAALNHGLDRLRDGFPLSLRLIREMHAKLLASGRGARQQPGEFRRSQNWIGGTRPGNAVFVPPPPPEMQDCLGALELFLHDEAANLPTLVKAALAHVQFETIHPFLDGNGRLGRLLITLILCAEGVLHQPVLYLSLFLKTHRARYYELLQAVRTDGVWEEWLDFFLEGVAETSAQASETARKLLDLFADDRAKIETLGRGTASALRVHQFFERSPLTTIPNASKVLGVSEPTVAKAIDNLMTLGILVESTGRVRNRRFVHQRYLDILSTGTEPLPR